MATGEAQKKLIINRIKWNNLDFGLKLMKIVSLVFLSGPGCFFQSVLGQLCVSCLRAQLKNKLAPELQKNL